MKKEYTWLKAFLIVAAIGASLWFILYAVYDLISETK